MPKCSFIIPCSRLPFHSDWVYGCIESLRNQTERDVEIIVGDATGCFTGVGDDRVRGLNLGNMPIVESINVMIDEAKSGIILPIGDDDWDEPIRAEVVIKELESCDIVAASYYRVDEGGMRLDTMEIEDWDYNKFITGNGQNIPVFSGGFKKTDQRFDPKFPHYCDVEYIINAYKNGSVVRTTKRVLSNFRVHQGQKSGGAKHNHEERKSERVLLKEKWNEINWSYQ